MAWKPEYAETRRIKAQQDPEYRARRNQQSYKDKEVRAEYMKAYYKANPEKFRPLSQEQRDRNNAARRTKYATCPDTQAKAKAEAKRWAQQNPDKRKAQRIAMYGLTLDQFNQMLEDQSGACLICGHSDMSKPNFFPLVDHCHKTGRVRGLLCMNCNQGIGKMQDSPELLRAAIAYLETSG